MKSVNKQKKIEQRTENKKKRGKGGREFTCPREDKYVSLTQICQTNLFFFFNFLSFVWLYEKETYIMSLLPPLRGHPSVH